MMKRWYAIAISLLCLPLLSACFVGGEENVSLRVELQPQEDIDNQSNTARIMDGDSGWRTDFAAALMIKLSADDLEKDVVADEKLEAQAAIPGYFELELEVEAGDDRALEGVLFIAKEPPLSTYASVEPLMLDLKPGDQAETAILSLELLPTGSLDLSIENAAGEWRLAVTDEQTGFALPSVSCNNSDQEGRICRISDLPINRRLLPKLVSADAGEIDLEEYAFELDREGDQATISLQNTP